MFTLIYVRYSATINVAAFSDEECDQLMEVALATRDSLRSENSDMRWRRVKVSAVELISLDLDADADLRLLCNMSGKDLVRSDKSNGDIIV